MLKKKQAGIPASRDPAAPRPQAVVNLMDALRRSIRQESGASVPSTRDRKRSGSAHTPVTHPTRALASPLEPTRPHSWAPTPPPPAGDCRKRNKQKEPPPARRLLPSRTRIRQRDG